MSAFVALHRGEHASLATDTLWLEADEWSACRSAAELLQRLQALHAERAARLAAAEAQARAAGHAAGREEALHATADALLASWREAADTAQADVHRLREAVIALSLEVVQRIAAELAPAEVVAALVRRAAEERLPDQPAVVRVHPEVAAAVRGRTSDIRHLEVRADPSLAPLACVLDTPTGQLLAGLQAQLARVAQALHAAAAAQGAE